jgi:hypothetical protein
MMDGHEDKNYSPYKLLLSRTFTDALEVLRFFGMIWANFKEPVAQNTFAKFKTCGSEYCC